MSASIITTLFLIPAIYFCYRWYNRNYNYWKNQSISNIPATSIFGNIKDVIFYRSSAAEHFQKIYNDEKTRNDPVTGIHFCHQPALFVRDPDIIKKVLVKDFNHFIDRHASSDPISDSIGTYNLFFVKFPLWKQIRSHLTPIFTTGKMKQFFHHVHNIGRQLDEHLQKTTENSKSADADIKEICALYTTDVIASVAYGIDANSMKNPDGDFRTNGKRIFAFTPWRALEFTTIFFLPQLVSFFKFKVFSTESTKFLRSTFNHIISVRESTKTNRNDLIDTLIKIRDTTDLKIGDKTIKFDGDLLVSQAAIFFTAGFETTSSTMSFGLYELAKNPKTQEKLREEIKDVLKEHNGEISYDIILNMKYLHMVVQEILRLYPPLPFLDRECCVRDGDSKEFSLEPLSDFKIPNGMPVIIPIFAIQRNKEYFPEPEKFIPERFAPENKDSIHPYTYMPFGMGGRVCIGERFGYMQAKIGLFYFLKSHYVKISAKTLPNMILEPKALIIQSKGGIYCDIVRDSLF